MLCFTLKLSQELSCQKRDQKPSHLERQLLRSDRGLGPEFESRQGQGMADKINTILFLFRRLETFAMLQNYLLIEYLI